MGKVALDKATFLAGCSLCSKPTPSLGNHFSGVEKNRNAGPANICRLMTKRINQALEVLELSFAHQCILPYRAMCNWW